MRRPALSLATFAAVLIGCGRSDLPETAPVSGTVTFKGRPLPGGTVTFHPEDDKAGNPAFGEIRSDGTFEMTTYKAEDGAILGKHIVTIEVFAGQAEMAPLPGTEEKTSTVPKRYRDPKTSPLRFEVKKGENTAAFPLQP